MSETHSKGLWMKNVWGSTRPSYQRRHMKLSQAPQCRSTFRFLLKAKSERCWHSLIPWLQLLWVVCWIRTNWRRHFGPCQSLTSFPVVFWLCLYLCPLTSCRGFAFQKLQTEEEGVKKNKPKKKTKNKLIFSSTTPNFMLQLIHLLLHPSPSIPPFGTSPDLYLRPRHPPLSPCFTFSPCRPFCFLIFYGRGCVLPLTVPTVLFTLSVLPRITAVTMVTSVPPCWKTSLCLHKKRYPLPAESCCRTALLLSNFHVL